MKGQNIYGGPAPEAMARMGEGIAQAYANVGKTYGAGYEAMGAGIAKGINSLGSSVADYKKMQSQVKTDAAAFDTFKDYLPPEVASKFDAQRQAIENDPKASLMDKASFYNSAKSYLGAAVGQSYKMDQINAEQKGLFARALAGRKPVPNLTDLSQGLTQAVSDQQPSQTAPKTAAPMPGSELDFENAVSTLENHMIKKYGADYKKRKIQASQQDITEAGLK